MRRTIWKNLLLTCSICGLAACGGGGGGGGAALISTPPPPPSLPTYPAIFPGVTQTTDFAALGYEVPDGFANTPILVGDGFAVRYDATQGAYIVDVPLAPALKFESHLEDADSWSGYLAGTSVNMDVAKPTASNRDPDFEFTTWAAYYQYDFFIPFTYGVMAFGSATPGGAVPTTGSAVFDAIVAGFALDTGIAVGGTALLEFNFGAGTLAGTFNPILNPNSATPIGLGTYTFTNTVFGVGSTTFSGGLLHANPQLTGAFNGLFTGPNAQELMARWTAGYVNPSTQQSGEMFGIWVGRKP